MEPFSLHFVSDELAQAYVRETRIEEEFTERELFQVGAGFARFLAERGTSFAADGLSLTAWEARVDRGISMLLRPPSRLFIDAGLSPIVARELPIRLDLAGGAMGGCYLPARLAVEAAQLLDRNLERSVRRLAEAEMDSACLQGLMTEAVNRARDGGFGLFEASGVVLADEPASWPARNQVVIYPSDKAVLQRIELALKPDEEPGMLKRFLGRFSD